MKAVVITSPGGPEVLQSQEVDDPAVGDEEVLIEVAAAALNRADTLQRKGSYPPPNGASPYPGLECSGTIIAVGKYVTRWKVGDQVCALLSGGGYAEKVAALAGQVLPLPPGVSLRDAASFPEVACTVWSTVFMTSRLSPGESFLIHGGSSGIGTFAIQMAKHLGIRVFVTAGLVMLIGKRNKLVVHTRLIRFMINMLNSAHFLGTEEKLAACKQLGADICINYKTEDFVARVKEETAGKGVDVILDNIGAPYLQRNLDSLNIDGRLFIIGFQGGTVTQVNLSCLLAKRLTLQAAGLRNRSPENKAVIVGEVEKNVWPAIAAGKVKPVVCKSFPLSEAAEAHRLMESSAHIGKILLIP
ncbi:quinone oxidoreductase PIG3 isoform X1 [Phoenix dactylifera]|uniref:Quinone oxidoreductase PIG3 isoform X1 n=1 Tax=Phoenix dactylifera TaxID=42345 RepID=A0A8B7BJ61_PHODC|nr:quinone oxidoreductase PIG3 isoform X1 [Phoenix dactylifera]